MTATSIKDDQGFKGLFPIGTLIHSRYEILSEGKMGGMGMVYKCKDNRHARLRDVALKLMQPKLLSSRESVERFRHEAAISRDLLHHPNIVRVYHDDEWQDGSGVVWNYLLMEWVEGRSLRDVLDQRKKVKRPFTVWEAYRIISQLAGALSYAHSQNDKVIHRDVKPENILIVDEATMSLKLADFGIAKIVSPEDHSSISTLLGVSPYMSPELREGSPDVDERTDIYSVGVVLYELLTLSNAAGPYCPSELNRAVPKEVDGIYKKAVAPNVEQRYQDVRALSDDLLTEARKEGVKAQAGAKGEVPPVGGPAGTIGKKRLKSAAIAVIALIVLAGSVAAYMGYRSSRENAAREGRLAAATQQEQADKERRALEEKKQEEAQKAEEARIAREREEKEKQARAEEKAKKQAAAQEKAASSRTQGKEDVSAKLKRWQKRLNLASLPEPKPASTADRTGSTVVTEPSRKSEPEKTQTQTHQEPQSAPPAPPRAVEEKKASVPSGSTADFYYRKGLQFIKSKHFLQASSDFSRAIEIDPGHELSYYWRGVAHYKLNNYTRALADFTNALRMSQNDLYYHWRGVVYFRQNNYYMAVNDFTQAIRLRPNNIDYRWRGACYHRLGKQPEAEADFTMASRLGYERGSIRGGLEQ